MASAASHHRKPAAHDQEWAQDAACRDTHVNMFPHPDDAVGVKSAKGVCGLCPVRLKCQDFALANNEEAGVWGGKSEQQRRSLRRAWLKRRRAERAS